MIVFLDHAKFQTSYRNGSTFTLRLSSSLRHFAQRPPQFFHFAPHPVKLLVDLVKGAVDIRCRIAMTMFAVFMMLVIVMCMFVVVAFTMFMHLPDPPGKCFGDIVDAGRMKVLDGLVNVANALLVFGNFVVSRVFMFAGFEMSSDFAGAMFQPFRLFPAASVDEDSDFLTKFVELSFKLRGLVTATSPSFSLFQLEPFQFLALFQLLAFAPPLFFAFFVQPALGPLSCLLSPPLGKSSLSFRPRALLGGFRLSPFQFRPQRLDPFTGLRLAAFRLGFLPLDGFSSFILVGVGKGNWDKTV